MPQATLRQVTRIWEMLLRIPDHALVRSLSQEEASLLIDEIDTKWREAGKDITKRRQNMTEIAQRLCQEKK